MPKKNDILRLNITALTSEGAGVGRTKDGYVVFVSGAAVGDVVDAHILKADKSYAYAKIEKLISPAADRTDTDCDVFGKCGGCMFRHIKYESELETKKSWVLENFRRIGKFDIEDIGIFHIASPDGYRNKAQYPAGKDKNGKLKFGFYATHSHRVVPCERCALEPDFYADIVRAAENFCNKFSLEPYDDESGKGLVRHLYIRDGRASGEVMAALIINADTLPHADVFVREMLGACDKIVSVIYIVNKKRGNEILGDKCVTLYGKDHITDTLCGLDFDISPLSFYQVNHDGAEMLYSIAKEQAALKHGDVLLDLYCGAGTIGLTMAKSAAKLYGVEIIQKAVENAAENARKNGISNAEFFCADAGRAAVELSEKGVRPNVIVIDPPRKGCGNEVFNAVRTMTPDRIVMISCNSATGARDAARLHQLGYEIKYLCAVDMFPRTGHVETVVLLSRAWGETIGRLSE
ncbi:MAG: 23S rRNA (uracil(1939)-C(5))-methyltransferase RlmD [Clostridiales bacterium]|nr:23S rRNA (uracil(1939)-C(5))-methyltransferase RlmD [Clostridiales bacterium]